MDLVFAIAAAGADPAAAPQPPAGAADMAALFAGCLAAFGAADPAPPEANGFDAVTAKGTARGQEPASLPGAPKAREEGEMPVDAVVVAMPVLHSIAPVDVAAVARPFAVPGDVEGEASAPVVDAASPEAPVPPRQEGPLPGGPDQPAATTEQTPNEPGSAPRTLTERPPAEGSPIERPPASSAPAGRLPIERTPTESVPAERAPAERPAERAPAERAPVESVPAERTPVERTPVDRTPVERTPVERTPIERMPAAVETPPPPAEQVSVVRRRSALAKALASLAADGDRRAAPVDGRTAPVENTTRAEAARAVPPSTANGQSHGRDERPLNDRAPAPMPSHDTAATPTLRHEPPPAVTLGGGASARNAVSHAMPMTPPAAPGVEPPVEDQVVRAIQVQLRTGTSEARLQLRPEHLGEVSIELKVTGDRVTATLHVERGDVRAQIETQAGTLRTALAAHGLRLDELVVRDEPRRDGGEPRSDEDRPRREPRPPQDGGARRRRSGDRRFELAEE